MRDEIRQAAERLAVDWQGILPAHPRARAFMAAIVAELKAAEERGRREMREEAAREARYTCAGPICTTIGKRIRNLPDKASR